MNQTTKGKRSKDLPPLRVVELFAGVGGFRLGLCGRRGRSKNYKLAWANQWEPGTAKQHAAEVYSARFHDGKAPNHLFNEDIFRVPVEKIPPHDVLTGGFPCQDYSVARTLSHAAGIEGKKGVLWWAIRDIVEHKRPQYLMLENVDRLLKSPAKQRGRDFAIILASLSDLGYAVEWRIINAADYGMPQRRRRTFILAYKKGSPIYRRLMKRESDTRWLTRTGVVARGFKASSADTTAAAVELKGELPEITKDFRYEFENAGLMVDRKFVTIRVRPTYSGEQLTLGDFVLPESEVPAEYFIPESTFKRWEYLKGAKDEPRASKTGFAYNYKEGPVAFPDPLNKPSRTIITGEGGGTPARHKHVIQTKSGRLRRLMPIELERLCMFPEDHTKFEGIGDQRRAFFMGNALVVGVIKKLGRALLAAHRQEAPAKKKNR